MTGLHLDLKAAHYRPEYLTELFARLASAGYDHVFIEIEDKVRLETTPGAEWCEAYTKEEFARILSAARRAGLTPIPLIQTLGHLEWLLSHSAWHGLRESPATAYMVCPSKPESAAFLVRYMDEVGELFGNPPYMHLGADEAWLLGNCPQCAQRVAAGSKSALFFEHMDKLFRHALSRGWRPIAWADIPLGHNEAIDRCSRDVIWMDWDYWTQASGSQVYRNWATGKHGGKEVFGPEFFSSEMGRFARGEDGEIRPWFYTDYLLHHGFEVIVAPAARCGGDHCFAPHIRHAGNVLGAALRAQRSPKPMGCMVTSWALRLNHVEMQWPSLFIPLMAQQRPATDWRDLRPELAEMSFGAVVPEFFDAWEKISPCFALGESWRAIETDLHYYGQFDSIPHLLSSLYRDGEVAKERAKLEALLPGHAEAARILDGIATQVAPAHRGLRHWRFAAKAIRARAEEEMFFLDALERPADRTRAGDMLLRIEALQDEYRALLLETYTPASVERELGMIFGAPWRHLMRLALGRTIVP